MDYKIKKNIRVLSVLPIKSEIVETTDDEWPIYQRYASDNWENRMGESWETVFESEELEQAYQSYKLKNEATTAPNADPNEGV